MISVTKIFSFDYAHFLPDYNGKCKEMHGHTGRLEIEVVASAALPVTYNRDAMIIDFGDLSQIVKENVLDKLDHSLINRLIEVPTAENMVKWIARALHKILNTGLVRVRLYETPDSYAEWKK